MNAFAEAMLTTKHSEEAWRQAWDATAAATAAGSLGIEFVSVDDESLVLRMPITDASRQPYGLLHGGVSMVLAESAASFHSSWNHDLSKSVPVGIEINGSHLRSARDGYVVAEARVIRRAESLVVHEIRITHEETGKLLNISRVTNMYVAPR